MKFSQAARRQPADWLHQAEEAGFRLGRRRTTSCTARCEFWYARRRRPAVQPDGTGRTRGWRSDDVGGHQPVALP